MQSESRRQYNESWSDRYVELFFYDFLQMMVYTFSTFYRYSRVKPTMRKKPAA